MMRSRTRNSGRIAAVMDGGERYPDLKGLVTFNTYMDGTWISAEITGLPGNGFLGFHLHEKGECKSADKFSLSGGHFNPSGARHPNHAGDFPVLLSCNGTARIQFYTNRITPAEAIGKSVIIHAMPDDYRTQPAGGAGDRIGCGVVKVI